MTERIGVVDEQADDEEERSEKRGSVNRASREAAETLTTDFDQRAENFGLDVPDRVLGLVQSSIERGFRQGVQFARQGIRCNHSHGSASCTLLDGHVGLHSSAEGIQWNYSRSALDLARKRVAERFEERSAGVMTMTEELDHE